MAAGLADHRGMARRLWLLFGRVSHAARRSPRSVGALSP